MATTSGDTFVFSNRGAGWVALAIACVTVVRRISSSFAITGADSVTGVHFGTTRRPWLPGGAFLHHGHHVGRHQLVGHRALRRPGAQRYVQWDTVDESQVCRVPVMTVAICDAR